MLMIPSAPDESEMQGLVHSQTRGRESNKLRGRKGIVGPEKTMITVRPGPGLTSPQAGSRTITLSTHLWSRCFCTSRMIQASSGPRGYGPHRRREIAISTVIFTKIMATTLTIALT